jgi:aflatoxin B1 aldehyde reductase
MYRTKSFKNDYFVALDTVKPVAEQSGLTMAEVALRWMTHHSQLGKKYPDAILIGASRLLQRKLCLRVWC